VAAEVGDAEVAHLARLAQRMEGVGDEVEIHQRIRAVDQQQIKMVGAQIAQRLLDRCVMWLALVS
jgi:hypothetical protein